MQFDFGKLRRAALFHEKVANRRNVCGALCTSVVAKPILFVRLFLRPENTHLLSKGFGGGHIEKLSIFRAFDFMDLEKIPS